MSVTTDTTATTHARLPAVGHLLRMLAACAFAAVAAVSLLFPTILGLSCLTLPALLVVCVLVTDWLSDERRFEAVFLAGMTAWIMFFAVSWGWVEVVSSVCWGNTRGGVLADQVATFAWDHFYKGIYSSPPGLDAGTGEQTGCPPEPE